MYSKYSMHVDVGRTPYTVTTGTKSAGRRTPAEVEVCRGIPFLELCLLYDGFALRYVALCYGTSFMIKTIHIISEGNSRAMAILPA